MSANGEEPADEGGAEPGDLSPLRSIRRQSTLGSEASPIYSAWWFVLLVALAPAGFVTLLTVERVRRRRLASRDAVRSRKAAQVALKELAKVTAGEVDGGEGINLMMRAINGFFVDRTGEPVSGLTHKEFGVFLRERGVPDELADRVVELTERSERSRYGGEGAVTRELATDAEELIREIDKVRMVEGAS